MASTFDVGDTIRTTMTFQSTAGVNADPTGTIRFLWKTPDGAVTATSSTGTGNIQKLTTGVYFYNLTSTANGAYWTRFQTTSGNIITAEESYYLVRAQQVAT